MYKVKMVNRHWNNLKINQDNNFNKLGIWVKNILKEVLLLQLINYKTN